MGACAKIFQINIQSLTVCLLPKLTLSWQKFKLIQKFKHFSEQMVWFNFVANIWIQMRFQYKHEPFVTDTEPQNFLISRNCFKRGHQPGSSTALSDFSHNQTKSVSCFCKPPDSIFVERLKVFEKHLFFEVSLRCNCVFKLGSYFCVRMYIECDGLLP